MEWTDIREEYETSSITLKALAEKHDIKLGTLKSRKSREGWSRGSPKKDATLKQKDATKIPDIENSELNDRQQLFCLYYLKYFNATKAYQKVYECAYTTARVEGSRSLANPNIIKEIDRLKAEQTSELKVGVMDILQKYIDIAFADITDYLKFGREEEIVYDEDGFPELDANSNVKMRSYNYVHLNESGDIDGTILTEVKQGRDGITVKLADKMKALEKLEQYFSLLSAADQSKLREEKLIAETEFIKERTKLIKGSAKDTSLLEALIAARKGSVPE